MFVIHDECFEAGLVWKHGVARSLSLMSNSLVYHFQELLFSFFLCLLFRVWGDENDVWNPRGLLTGSWFLFSSKVGHAGASSA